MEPLYEEQKPRFERLVRSCERIIASYEADLADLQVTPLPPNWKIKKSTDLAAGRARAIYEADPTNRARSKWQDLLGISYGSVNTVLERAGIDRTAYTEQVEVDSKSDLLRQASQRNARITAVESDGVYQRFDAAMEIPKGSMATLQPPAKHKIVSDEQPEIKPAPAKASVGLAPESRTEQADNMEKPGNWHKPNWDPQFIYWERGQGLLPLAWIPGKDGVGICDLATGEVWQNPTLHELLCLIAGAEQHNARDVA